MGQYLLMLGLSVAAHPLGISISKKQVEIKLEEKHTVLTRRLEKQAGINSAPLCLSESTENKYLVLKHTENIYAKARVKPPQGSMYKFYFI